MALGSPASFHLPAAHCSVFTFFCFHGSVWLEYAYVKVKVLGCVFEATLAGLNLCNQPGSVCTTVSPSETKHLEHLLLHFIKKQTPSLTI